MTTFTATYSPDDNKLRLTASTRLDAATYQRVKEAGFAWAPKQEQFIAPMWTPHRADLCIELAGEIEDDDRTLMERAEERAERFGEYEDKRGADAQRATEYVRTIADGIPLGQPILVGHHSEARARKDAERIENGMRKAVRAFETAAYWKARAAGALRHAKYKEDPGVRHRRIKGLESDQRKQQKSLDEHEAARRVWLKVPRYEWDKQTALATYIAGRVSVGSYGIYSDLSGGRMHGDTAWRLSVAQCERSIAHARRWLDHIANRLEYERAMLDESGGIAAQAFDLQPGGVIGTTRGRRQVIVRVNRKDGAAVSVSVAGQGWTVGIEEITSYEPPTDTAAAAVAASVKLAPICNYPSEGCATMTQTEWNAIYKDHKGTRTIKATETQSEHRRRMVMGFLGTKYGAPRGEAWGYSWVYISDAKRTDPADPNAAPKAPRKSMARKIAESAGIDTSDTPETVAPAVPTLRDIVAEATEPTLSDVLSETARLEASNEARQEREAKAAPYEAMREALRTGVQVVSAPQLFPTPPELAARMVAEAGIESGMRILEPSAGTGRILDALRGAGAMYGCVIRAVEINPGMAHNLTQRYPGVIVDCRDFMAWGGDCDPFDVVLMNPPFADGADIEHVTHAAKLLAPGGRLVAVVSAGVRFRSDRKTREFRALIERMGTIEELPAGTFENSGTGVNTVLVVLDAPASQNAAQEAAA